MQPHCDAVTRCLFCAFAHVAHLHSDCPALLQPQIIPRSCRHTAADGTGSEERGGGGEAGKDSVEVEGIEGEEGGGGGEGGDLGPMRSALQPKQFCLYKNQARNPSSNISSPLCEPPSIPCPSQVHEHPLPLSSCLETPLPILHEDKALSYFQVLACANSLALQLQKAIGNSSDDGSCDSVDDSTVLNSVKKVGIFMGPSVEYVVAVLAVLQCGYAFVPLEPSWPARRIQEVVADSNPSILLTDKHPRNATMSATFNSVGLCIMPVNLWPTPALADCLKLNASNCVCFCHTNQVRPYCYLLYTSGSSGKPKGVYGTETGLLHRLQWMQREYPFFKGDVAMFKSSTAFVDHLTELFGPLLGGSLVIVPPVEGLYRNPLGLLPFIQTFKVSRFTAVPSLMRSVLPSLSSCPNNHALMSIKVLVLSGENLSHNLLKSIQALLPHTTILNLYGSTELSGDCMCFDCGALDKAWGDSSVPIGKPLPGCLINIVSENSESGDEGELWVGGVLVALGYHHDTSGTGSRFIRIPDTAGKHCKAHFFRTGDYVRMVKDGNLLFLGRKDRIVKVNGHRICLDEIESDLERHRLVAQAAVVIQNTPSMNGIIVAYVVSKQQRPIVVNKVPEASQGLANTTTDEDSEILSCLKRWLIERLPSSMIPSRFKFLDVVPTVSAGKKDYHALTMLDVSVPSKASVDPLAAEFSGLACRIKKAFQDVLNMDHISIFDDFFSLGGTSVSAAHVAHLLAIDMRLLYSHSSVIKLEPVLRALQEEAVGSSALRLDEVASSDWRAFKRVKRDESLNACEVAASACYSGENWKPLNSWPSANIADPPIAFLRCNVIVPSNPCPCSPATIKVSNLFCDPVSTSHIRKVSILWRTELKACVDASPVLVQFKDRWRLFIGSHAHNFLCLDAFNGNVVWERYLWDRVESTAALTSDFKQVVVGSYDGNIYFLESETGVVNWKFGTKAEVKCQPTVGMQEGLVWCGSHDHHLYALNPVDQKCVWEHDCKASIFAAATHDFMRCLTYVATTAGTIIAFSTEGSQPRFKWMHVCEAPVFASPALDATSGYIVCTMVNGCVTALSSSGSVVWKYTTGGPVFAGATLTSALPLQVLTCCRDGWVYSLHLLEGRCLWRYCLGEPITSAAYVDEGLDLVCREAYDDTVYHHSYRLLCVCGSLGQVHLLKVYAGSSMSTASSCPISKEWHGGRKYFAGVTTETAKLDARKNTEAEIFSIDNSFELLAVLKLDGDIFSSPVMLGGRIFVGCRDNHIYCLETSGLGF